MNDNLILPDDKTIERLALEYSKVKVKAFGQNENVSALSLTPRRTYKLVAQPPYNKEAVSTLALQLVSVYQKGFSLIRQIASNSSDEKKVSFKVLLREKQSCLEKLNSLKLYGEKSAYVCQVDDKQSGLSTKSRIARNFMECSDIYKGLLSAINVYPIKRKLSALFYEEQNLTISFLLLLV
ncbi:MAG: hypothetical protein RSB20_04205 [Clostridia bacterium]